MRRFFHIIAVIYDDPVQLPYPYDPIIDMDRLRIGKQLVEHRARGIYMLITGQPRSNMQTVFILVTERIGYEIQLSPGHGRQHAQDMKHDTAGLDLGLRSQMGIEPVLEQMIRLYAVVEQIADMLELLPCQLTVDHEIQPQDAVMRLIGDGIHLRIAYEYGCQQLYARLLLTIADIIRALSPAFYSLIQ